MGKDVDVTERLRTILIAGPTASGKSALAISLARRCGGIVINADSMQVYRDLRIITARPSVEDEAVVPHALYGHVDGAENYSVGRYLADIESLLASARENRTPVIITGGTGLYFKTLIEGLSDIPPVPEDVRSNVRARAEGRDTPLLYADLAVRDPQSAARIGPTDRQRILRALEVLAATGRSLTFFRSHKRPGLLSRADRLGLFLMPDRTELARRIDGRFLAMMEAGALEEVRTLAARGLHPDLPVMRAHGVPWLIRHLGGEISLDEAIREAQSDTRRYAKRQFTFFRHQLGGFQWVTPEEAERAVAAQGWLEWPMVLGTDDG
ncbi:MULTISPECIES: tRNA (adenosine(37)-N6)-dimethylallyltransferase MiaA [unclassified Chelatococcus]|uniref:tRNA (adenosine(37)-N6)-dimethylallyltransferase MiaA n=1 Tax=unclassified Chelatococcus TaxID=2638111 RepID=UPI001BD05A35|nr:MULTISPECIES: tRNA (adenosine(37)-N6)-dimethylallyltransferase MiaA [unclassified Chelatococcus]MBS7697952.1 tRNA (adenosine(37)-N6)-dimethylallyltransferase MiaA [Chelatococcus sp. YT9]MBX3558471.1 tRNA (adenosine(37)-N6)-dimethylallyltransferase MiaA [Chelatococcus sp.]